MTLPLYPSISIVVLEDIARCNLHDYDRGKGPIKAFVIFGSPPPSPG